MRHQVKTITLRDGVRMAYQVWQPEGAVRGTLILVHGVGEHGGRYGHVAEYFIEQGYACYALDHRGHGRNATAAPGLAMGYFPSLAEVVDDLHEFVGEVNKARPANRPVFMIGHSMGGLVTLYYLIRHHPPPSLIRGVVTSGAALDVGDGTPILQKSLLLNIISPLFPKFGVQAIPPEYVSRDVATVEGYKTDPLVFHGKVFARVAAELFRGCAYVKENLAKITLPMLILHGGEDKVVSPKCASILHAGISSPNKQMKLYEGLYHEIFNEPERNRVMGDVWVWLAAHGATGELKKG
ncbi:MAG TPA: lysophospholipase [Aggregatilineales bacterium]|nr:alpha/beta hydrolase [Anaerolineales bacterium]HRE47225.1 lysophospholipase [Aggregatilineales bacterium]